MKRKKIWLRILTTVTCLSFCTSAFAGLFAIGERVYAEEATEYESLNHLIDLTGCSGNVNGLGSDDAGINRSALKHLFDGKSDYYWSAKTGAENNAKTGFEKSIQWIMKEAVKIDKYSITTGWWEGKPNTTNDSRDPAEWTLKGTNDLSGSWVVVDKVTTGADDLATGSGAATTEYVVENAGEYKYYQLTVTAIRADNDRFIVGDMSLYTIKQDETETNDRMSITEAETNGLVQISSIIEQTSITGDAGISTSSGLAKLFDLNHTNAWRVATATGEVEAKTVQWSMKEKVALKGYALVTGPNLPERDPRDWKLYGANDVNGEWTLLDEKQDEDLTADRSTASDVYKVQQAGKYQHYKLVFTNNKGQKVTDKDVLYQMSEILVYADAIEMATDYMAHLNENACGDTSSGDDSDTSTDDDNPSGGDTSSTNKITIAEAEAQGLAQASSAVDASSITGDAGISTSSGLDKLFDLKYATTWRVATTTGKVDAKTVQWSMTDKVALKGYALVTGPNLPERDPRDWKLYGTNDVNGEWTLLSEIKDETMISDRSTATDIYLIEQPSEYQHYKLVFTNNKGQKVTDKDVLYQLGGILMYADKDAIPSAGDDNNSAGGDNPSAGGDTSSTNKITIAEAEAQGLAQASSAVDVSSITGDAGISTSSGLDKLFDLKYATTWRVATTTGKVDAKTVQWSMTDKVALKGYALVTGPNLPGRDPAEWKFYGTNDVNGEWTLLSEIKDETMISDRSTATDIYLIEQPREYQHYKLVFMNNKGQKVTDTDVLYQLGEILLYADKNDIPAASVPETPKSSSSDTSIGETLANGLLQVNYKIDKNSIDGDAGISTSSGILKLFDSNFSTTWRVATTTGKVDAKTVQWAMEEKMTLKGYSFVTGPNLPERDPADWKLYGTNDVNGDWTLLDEIKNEALKEDRSTATNLYMINQPGEYQYYKLVYTNNKGQKVTGTDVIYHLNEILLYAETDDIVPEVNKTVFTDIKHNPVEQPNEDTTDTGVFNVWWIIPIVTVVIAGATGVTVFILKRKKAKSNVKTDV